MSRQPQPGGAATLPPLPRARRRRRHVLRRRAAPVARAHDAGRRPDGVVKIHRYWNPPVNTEFASSRSDDSYAQEFAARYDRVVARHLISDVPVGVPLSGGLDSSGVVATMARLMQHGAHDLRTDGLYSFSTLYPGRPSTRASSSTRSSVRSARSLVPRTRSSTSSGTRSPSGSGTRRKPADRVSPVRVLLRLSAHE